MALSYSTSVKDQVANYCFSANTYAALGAGYQQSLIDKWGASVLTELEEWSKWFSFAAAAGAAPDQWEPWYVDAIIARIEGNAHPERAQAARAQERKSMRMALDTFTRQVVTYDPSATTEAFVYHAQNNRKYVLSHCIRLDKPLYPDMATVDAALDEALTFVWNKAQWAFARRPVAMKITRTAFTGGTWTESTKTISGLTGVSASLAAGTRFYPTGGTGVNQRDFVIASTTSTTIVLVDSLGSAADAQTDIAGFYYAVTFEGMQSSESFDSIASGKWNYTDVPEQGSELCWQDSSAFALCRSVDGDGNTGRPRYFRTHQPSATVTAFLFSPPPDADYVLRGEVIVRQAADPSSATDTGPFAKFAVEFMPCIRRLQLCKVLTNHGRHDDALYRQVMDEVETLFPTYQDTGDPSRRGKIRDAYCDVAELTDGSMTLGGGM